MKERKFLAFFAGFLFLIVLSGCTTNALKKECVLNGMIYDANNEPVPNANIFINNDNLCSSDVYGHFSIAGLKMNQNYTLVAKKSGFEDSEITFDYTNVSQMVYLRMNSLNQLLSMAENSMKTGNLSATREILARVNSVEENNFSALYLEAIILYKEKEFEKSIAVLEGLLKKKSDSYIYLLLADNYQYGFNDTEKAKENLKLFLNNEYNQEIEARYSAL